MKNILFPTFNHTRSSIALLLVRLVIGIGMMLHGTSKIQNPWGWMGPDSPVPGVLQALAALSEFGGGLAWVLGLLVPLASFGIFCTMAVAVYTHAIVKGDPFVGKNGSYELGLIYLVIAVLLMLQGPGRFSLDHLINKKRVS